MAPETHRQLTTHLCLITVGFVHIPYCSSTRQHHDTVKNSNCSWDSCNLDTKQLVVALSPRISQASQEVRWLMIAARKVLSPMRCLCKTIWLLQLFFPACVLLEVRGKCICRWGSPLCSDLFYDFVLLLSARGTEERKEHQTWSQKVCVGASALQIWVHHLTSQRLSVFVWKMRLPVSCFFCAMHQSCLNPSQCSLILTFISKKLGMFSKLYVHLHYVLCVYFCFHKLCVLNIKIEIFRSGQEAAILSTHPYLHVTRWTRPPFWKQCSGFHRLLTFPCMWHFSP